MVAVDNPQNVQAISEAAAAKGVTVRMLIEVNIGMDRCGVEPGKPALELANQIRQSPNLKFEGLMGYEGHTVAKPDLKERKANVQEAMQHLIDTKDYVEKHGIEVSIMSGGGTGTFNLTGSIPEMTEVQAGSYIFMDSTYRKRRRCWRAVRLLVVRFGNRRESSRSTSSYSGYRLESACEESLGFRNRSV